MFVVKIKAMIMSAEKQIPRKKTRSEERNQTRQRLCRETEEPNKLEKKRKIQVIMEIYKEGKSRLFN